MISVLRTDPSKSIWSTSSVSDNCCRPTIKFTSPVLPGGKIQNKRSSRVPDSKSISQKLFFLKEVFFPFNFIFIGRLKLQIILDYLECRDSENIPWHKKFINFSSFWFLKNFFLKIRIFDLNYIHINGPKNFFSNPS